jgi:hypothetical protein
VQVLNENEKGASMPADECVWNETMVDLVLKDKSIEVDIQKLVHFFVSVGVKQINEGVVKKLYDSGMDTILKIISATKDDFLKVPTIKDKMSDRLVTNLRTALTSINLADFLTGSGVFGMGIAKKKIVSLLTAF